MPDELSRTIKAYLDVVLFTTPAATVGECYRRLLGYCRDAGVPEPSREAVEDYLAGLPKFVRGNVNDFRVNDFRVISRGSRCS